MNVIVVGCGRVGSELAGRLSRRGHDVTVIDYVGSSFVHLDPAYRGRTIEAEPLGEGVLENAGIREAHALAAVTNSDPVNAVVAHAARTLFQVPTVVVRNYDPRWRPLLEELGLQTVSTTAWGSQRIEEMIEAPGLRSVFSAGNGEVELYELRVPRNWGGRTVGSVVEGFGLRLVALSRGGRAAIPEPDTLLEPEDILHVGATLEGADILRRQLAGLEA